MTATKPPRDKRAYFNVDIGYFQNPKLAELVSDHPRAVMLHLQAVAYCAQHLTDGVFNPRIASALTGASICGSHCEGHCDPQCDLGKLMHHGLVELNDDGSYEVHDYLLHNRSASSVKGASAAGQKAARERWGEDGTANRNADRIPNRNAKKERKKLLLPDAPDVDIDTQDVETPTREQARRQTAKKTTRTNDLPDGFVDFWTTWPRKDNKPAAIKAWKAATQRATIDEITAGLAAQLPELLTRDGRYRPMASSWLNGDRWEDEPTELSGQARRAQAEDEEAARLWTPRVELTETEMVAHEAASLERIAARNAATRAEEENRNDRANGIADLKAANLWPRDDTGAPITGLTTEQIDELIRNNPRKACATAV